MGKGDIFDVARLRNYLLVHGIKHSFLAQKIGVSNSVMCAILQRRFKCSVARYIAICKALAIPYETFINADSHRCTDAIK